jgi:hypothetical protein
VLPALVADGLRNLDRCGRILMQCNSRVSFLAYDDAMKPIRRLRLSLRMLLVLTAILGAGIGIYLNQAKRTIRGVVILPRPAYGVGMMTTKEDGPKYMAFKSRLMHYLNSREVIADALHTTIGSAPSPRMVDQFVSKLEVYNPDDSDLIAVELHQHRYIEDPTQGLQIINALLDDCEAKWKGAVSYRTSGERVFSVIPAEIQDR